MHVELIEMGAHKLSGLPFENAEEARIRISDEHRMNIVGAVADNWDAIREKEVWLLVQASKFDDRFASVTSGVIAIKMGRFKEPDEALAIARTLQERIVFSQDSYEGICVIKDLLVDPQLKPEAEHPNLLERVRVWHDKPYETWTTSYETQS